MRATLAATLLLTCLCSTAALAQPTGIGPGREAEVLALIQPYADEGPVAPGTRLVGIEIAPQRILLRIQADDGQKAELILRPLPLGPERRSFAIEATATHSQALRASQDLLRSAVLTHDKGQFALAVAPPQPAQGWSWPADLVWQCWLAGALWLLLLASLLRRAPMAPPLEYRRLGLALGLVALALAFGARLDAPFWVLHTNDHGFSDIALALRVPTASAQARHDALSYGVSWVLGQQTVVQLFGAHHDGLARSAAAVGALTAWLSYLAAWRASRSLWGALLGGLAVALVPAAVRVGHSESVLVYAQFLLAAALYLASGAPSRLASLGIVAAGGLLTLGSPIGPGYAIAAALLAWALVADPGLTRRNLALVLAFLAPALAGLALSRTLHGQAVIDHLVPTGGPLPGTTGVLGRALWLSADWAPQPLWIVALLGLIAFLRHRRWPQGLALALALAALVVTGIATAACVSATLRYQSVWAPAIALLVAWMPSLATSVPPWLRLRLGFALAALTVWLAVGLARPGAGAKALDAQGQAYQKLRSLLDNQKGDIALVVAEQRPGAPCLAAPVGRWSAKGPTVREIRTAEAASACQREGKLPLPAWVSFEPACSAQAAAGPVPACEQMAPFAGKAVLTQTVMPLATPPGLTLDGEFLHFTPDQPQLRIAVARCPGQ